MLFSQPEDYTTVCTTELGTVTKLNPEFEKLDFKCINISVDNVKSYIRWISYIEENQITKFNYTILANSDHKFSGLYDIAYPNADTKSRCKQYL